MINYFTRVIHLEQNSSRSEIMHQYAIEGLQNLPMLEWQFLNVPAFLLKSNHLAHVMLRYYFSEIYAPISYLYYGCAAK